MTLIPLLTLAGCAGEESSPGAMGNEVARPVSLSESEAKKVTADLNDFRRRRDINFLEDPNSPLADEYRANFQGLKYYPINLQYRFKGFIHRLPEREQFQIMSTGGELRDAIHWGYFRFSLDGEKSHTLQVYKMMDLEPQYQDMLFMPFMDSRAGRETYGGGRYLDIEERSDGIYTIDFNEAYNPSCAYGKAYSCPLTPYENRLKIPIPVGEKSFQP